MKQRIYSLDILRGLVAFAILLYHYSTWAKGNDFIGFDAANLLGRIGIYGVSIFFVLSGLALQYVYFERLSLRLESIFSFFTKRVFRIFPLLWLVTLISIFFIAEDLRLSKIVLNLTGLFSFVKWSSTYSVGVWSIGNELVYYTLLPFIFYFDYDYPLGYRRHVATVLNS